MIEDFVNFETAKLLKEKGFDLPVNYVYHYWTKTPFFHRKIKNFNSEEYRNLKNEWYSAPTQSLAMKWLREVHNIFIAINMIPDTIQKHYFFKLYLGGKIYNFPLEYSVEFYTIYEEACEAAIKYCLENLI